MRHREHIDHFDRVVVDEFPEEETHDLEGDAGAGMFEHFEER